VKENNLMDQYIKANFKLMENELGIACVAAGCGFALLSSFVGILLLLPLLAVSIYFFFKAMRKLFYDSIYGKSAYLFQSLPVSPSQLVSCKIFAAGLSFLLLSAVMVGAGLVIALFQSGIRAYVDGLMQDFVDQGAVTEQLPLILAAEFLAVCTASFRDGAVYFLGVITYQSMP